MAGLLLVWAGTALARHLTDDVAEEQAWLARHLDEVASDVADDTWTEVRDGWVDGGASIPRAVGRIVYRPKYPWPGDEDYAFAAFELREAGDLDPSLELYVFPPYIDRQDADDDHLPDWSRDDLERASALESEIGHGAGVWTTAPERARDVVSGMVGDELHVLAEEHLKGLAITPEGPNPVLLVVAGISGPETLERYLAFLEALGTELKRSSNGA